jgi:hypothetical protein
MTNHTSLSGGGRKWQQQDGTWIDLKDMTKKHLQNTIAMLERTKTVSILVEADDYNGEVAHIHDEEMIRAMKNELTRRN